jgi:hypothetical protein
MIPRRRLYVAYARPAGIYERWSEDDGNTWTAEAATFAGDTHPELCCSKQGVLLRAAYSAGSIEFTRQTEGDATSTAPAFILDDTGTPLSVQDDRFRIAASPDNRFWIHVKLQGHTKACLLWSSDDGASWTLYSETFNGSRPGLTIGSDGLFVLWAYLSNTISTAVLYPGSPTIIGPFTLKNEGGSNLLIESDSVSFAQARENAHRHILVCRAQGETAISTYWSADLGATATRFS